MKIATAQLTCTPADLTGNLKQLGGLAEEARGRGAELVVFPELALTGYELDAVLSRRDLWIRPDDARLDALRAAGIGIVVNCVAATEEERPAIETLVFGPEGDLLTTYRKQHLFEHEQEAFVAGRHDGRFEFGGLRFGLATCFDNHFSALLSRVAADRCQVLLASSLYGTSGGVEELARVYPGIAEAFGLHVVLANHVGPAGPWTGCGRSGLWSPGGGLLVQADAERAMVVLADVEPGAA
ncbi:carbon-nitrogen hydrolase family protein [Streptomyces sp. LHD-70]|uniref:carbon-nitrogen hydrolase family protein n=1 Tax=Streptomyces sp. LHD-70 TaxID=3072140 RepID=UPI00280DC1D6|nr:carbon-nitrogen hydrolase family protein [Streptomyces sp. LHD-70]MDQ8702717.1 carbon-nitrogen hydrolase family protein [Streptomyces sp. LHD-70]